MKHGKSTLCTLSWRNERARGEPAPDAGVLGSKKSRKKPLRTRCPPVIFLYPFASSIWQSGSEFQDCKCLRWKLEVNRLTSMDTDQAKLSNESLSGFEKHQPCLLMPFDACCLLMLIDAYWCYLMLIDATWCLLMLIDATWCYLMLIDFDAYWCLLMLVDAYWCLLMLLDAYWCYLMLIDSYWCYLMLLDAYWFWCLLMLVDACWCLLMLDAYGVIKPKTYCTLSDFFLQRWAVHDSATSLHIEYLHIFIIMHSGRFFKVPCSSKRSSIAAIPALFCKLSEGNHESTWMCWKACFPRLFLCLI